MSINSMEDVIKLASTVSDATDNEIPSHLLRLKTILRQHEHSAKELSDLKEVILEYDLLSWCAIVLKFDYSKMENGFATAVSIVEILSDCCTSMDLEKYQELKDLTLHDSVHTILYLAFVILEQYHEYYKQFKSVNYGVHAEIMASRKTQYLSILSSLVKLVTSQRYLAKTVLESDNLIRLLIEDSEEMEKMQVIVLELVQRCVRVDPICVEKLPTSSLNHLLDELIFKITTSKNDKIVGLTVKILLIMVDAYPELASKMTMRFKGLKALMTKWLGHGFDYNLKNLLDILDAGNAKIAELARRTHAVKVIWAAYQGWKTRTRVGKLHKVVPSLQSSFRRKRQEKLEIALKEKLGSEKKYKDDIQRKRQVRSAREKQLQMLEIVPARNVNRYIQNEEEKAAVKIQSSWRGSSQRKIYKTEKERTKKINAAVTIQRFTRKFLNRRKEMKLTKSVSVCHHSKMQKDVREGYQFKIEQNKALRGKREVTLADTLDIHDKAQQRLLIYHSNRHQRLNLTDPKLDALLAKIHTEEEVLSNLPSLSVATKVDVDNLSSGSNAVSVAAEREHHRTMKEFSSQWWQKLAFKSGDSLDPFNEKIEPVYDQDRRDIEEFLNDSSNLIR